MENIKDMELTNKEDILKRLGCPNAEVTAEELESLSKSDSAENFSGCRDGL